MFSDNENIKELATGLDKCYDALFTNIGDCRGPKTMTTVMRVFDFKKHYSEIKKCRFMLKYKENPDDCYYRYFHADDICESTFVDMVSFYFTFYNKHKKFPLCGFGSVRLEIIGNESVIFKPEM